MLGRTHCMSGAAVGIALAPLVGQGSLTAAIPFAATTAGWALVPDLDCQGATASRLLGPVTGWLSSGLHWASKRLYQATRGPQDEGGTEYGGHRHLTHCALWCLAIGLLAGLTSLASPWVTLGWVAFGVLAAHAALGNLVLALSAAAVSLSLLADQAGTFALLAGMSGLPIGIAAGIGCLTHIFGDMCTVTGCPLLFPLLIRDETWQELHLLPRPIRLHTASKEHLLGYRFEKRVVFPFFALAAFGFALLLPDIGPHLHAFIQDPQGFVRVLSKGDLP